MSGTKVCIFPLFCDFFSLSFVGANTLILQVLYGLGLLLSSLGIDFGISQVLLNLVMALPNSRTNETECVDLSCLLRLPSSPLRSLC
jgi:hypothetical protein